MGGAQPGHCCQGCGSDGEPMGEAPEEIEAHRWTVDGPAMQGTKALQPAVSKASLHGIAHGRTRRSQLLEVGVPKVSNVRTC